MEEEKRVPNYNPKEDDKEYIGTKLLDGIERGASSWYKDERTLEGWEYLNPFSVATAGAIRGVEGVGWVLGNTPVAGDLLRGIGWAEDRLAEGARNISGALTPDLDPRFAGWGTRLGTAILADKGIRKVAGATKATLKEGAERAAVRSGKKYTSTRPETMSDVWRDDLAGPRKTYERYSKKGYYPENPPPDPWLKEDLINRIDFVDPNLDDMMRMSEGLNPRRWRTTFEQGDLFGTPDAVSKNLPDFVVQTVRKDMPAYAKEVPDAYIDYNKMRNWFYSSETGGRKAVETLMTPVVPGTQISRGIKIDGKFGLRERELPKLRKNFKPILKSLGIDQAESASIHHIAALKATFGILHKVQFDSPLFRKTFDALLEHVPGLGTMEGNLMPVIGRATRTKTGGVASSSKQALTPHNIVHRFYSNIIGESGELFFKPEVLEEMVKNDAYRIEKAHELGRIIARSEEIVKEAQEIWRLAGSQENIHFHEIVNKLSQLDELGYKKLASTEYQTPLLSEMIKDVVLDIKVEKDQLRRLTPQSKKIVSGRTPDLVQARNLLADKKELLKTTKNPKQRKQLQQDIAELEREIKGPPPKQGKLPLRGYTKKPK